MSTIRLYEVAITHEFSGGNPVWTSAIVYTLPFGSTEVTIPALGDIEYAVRVRSQDIFGNFSNWTAAVTHTTLAGSDTLQTELALLASGLDHLIAHDELNPRIITADLLASTIVLASLLQIPADPATFTGTGTRVEIGSDGITLYEAISGVDVPIVRIPVNGDPVTVRGTITAGESLVSETASELRGTTSFPPSAVVTAQSGVQSPAGAPSLVESLAYVDRSQGGINAGPQGVEWGIDFDSSDSTYYGVWAMNDGSDNRVIYQWHTDGSIVRTQNIGGPGQLSNGVAVTSTHVFVLRSSGNLYKYLKTDLSLVGSAALAAQFTVPGNTGMFYDSNLDRIVCVTTTGTGAGKQVRFRLINPSTLAVASTLDATGYTIDGSATTTIGGAYVSGYYWVVIDGTQVRKWNATTGAYVSDNEFGMTSAGSFVTAGVCWNGTNFVGIIYGGSAMYSFTSWDWTTASAKYWACYAWYDSNATGGTHETAVGPRSFIIMNRRTRLTITNAAIPTGPGTDDPDKVRIYMAPNATDPGVGNFKLQATDALTSRVLTTYNSGGGADGGGTAFPGATPAELKSAAAGWSLKGSGLMNFGGTSFPGSPATNDQFYRTDLSMWFYYDGTRWLSVQLFVTPSTLTTTLQPYSATATNADKVALLGTAVGNSDIYLLETITNFFVSGGTALGASHKWVLTGVRQSSGSALATTIASIDSGASSAWRQIVTTHNALLTGATAFDIDITSTKTGTPGALYVNTQFVYRLVAT